MTSLTALDIVVFLLIGGFAVFGLIRGFVTEAISLFSWVAAIFALNLLHAPATRLMGHFVSSSVGAAILAFALVFGVVFIAGKLVAAEIGGRVRASALGPFDRVLGLGFGALKGLIAATLLFLLLTLFVDLVRGGGGARPDFMTQSRSFTLLNASSRAVVNFVRARQAVHPSSAHDENAATPST
jgi:membrane protein required for colicin V production